MYILSELYNFYAFTAVEKHNEYQNLDRVLNYLKEKKWEGQIHAHVTCVTSVINSVRVCLFVNGNNSISIYVYVYAYCPL